MSEPRASTILAEANGDVTTLRAALINSDATIRAAALGALARLRHLELAELHAGLVDPHPAVRCRAIELSIDHTEIDIALLLGCLLYTSPSPRDQRGSRMPSSA